MCNFKRVFDLNKVFSGSLFMCMKNILGYNYDNLKYPLFFSMNYVMIIVWLLFFEFKHKQLYSLYFHISHQGFFSMKHSLLAVLVGLALAACGESNNTAPATTAPSAPAKVAPAEIVKKAEHYLVGTDIGYPPFDFRDKNGQITGFDVDVLKAIAEDQNFSVEFLFTQRSKLFPSLETGQYQILAACLGINPERLSKSEMSDAYAYAPNVIMGKEADKDKVRTLADLTANDKVSVQQDSHSHHALEDAKVANIVPNTSVFNAYSQFVRGDVQYVVGDAGVLNYAHSNNQDAKKPKVFTSVYNPSEDVRVAFAVQKGNTKLVEKINAGLKNIKANGTYDKIYAKWFGNDNSLRVPENKAK